jgi:hypothetical protein
MDLFCAATSEKRLSVSLRHHLPGRRTVLL